MSDQNTIDEEEYAVAVLTTVTADGRIFTDYFSSKDGYEDPMLKCEQMRAAVGDDFPGATFGYTLNEKARNIMTNRRMAAMGFPNYDHATAKAEEAAARAKKQ